MPELEGGVSYTVIGDGPPLVVPSCNLDWLSIPRFRTAQFLGTYEGFAQRGEVPVELRRRFYYPRGIRRREPIRPEIGTPIPYEELGPR